MKVFLILSVLCPMLCARDIHVGKDAPTIAYAIKAAQPGDSIHLEPKIYRDYAGFYGKKGEPGKPITLDGHGATLEGSDPLDPAQRVQRHAGVPVDGEVVFELERGAEVYGVAGEQEGA